VRAQHLLFKLDFEYGLLYFERMRPIVTSEAVLGSRSKIRVLRELRGTAVPLSTSEIARRIGMSQPAAAAALNALADYGIINSSGAGRARVHTLARQSEYVQQMIEPLFAAEDDLPERLVAHLRVCLEPLARSVVVFGSYARDEHEQSSDLDLVVVAEDHIETEALETGVLQCARDIRLLFGVGIAAIVYTPRDAAELKVRAPALFSEVDRDGIVVCGLAPWQWGEPSGA
jgi:predicted nucleotidyltransferase/DNA-binding HxlR family transcriptional regulator